MEVRTHGSLTGLCTVGGIAGVDDDECCCNVGQWVFVVLHALCQWQSRSLSGTPGLALLFSM
jgi:hypothetical protein